MTNMTFKCWECGKELPPGHKKVVHDECDWLYPPEKDADYAEAQMVNEGCPNGD